MKIFKRLFMVVILAMSSALPTLAQDATPDTSGASSGMLPQTIVYQTAGLFPEGIEWDAARERFLVGSLGLGTIYQVTDDGTATPLIEDADLISTVGIEVDEARDRLLVVNSDAAVFSGVVPDGPQVSLAAYDLESGERLFFTDMTTLTEGAWHFGNDVAVDAEGNAYVTDSFYPAIYKVDLEGNASIFLEDQRFINEFFGLNGIEYHPDGYLLVALAGAGQIYKIPLDDPQSGVPVVLPEFVGGDGLVLDEAGNLVVVATTFDSSGNEQYEIVRLTSTDGWVSAQVSARVPDEKGATTAAIRDGAVYVTYARLDALGSAEPPTEFEIGLIPFAPAQ